MRVVPCEPCKNQSQVPDIIRFDSNVGVSLVTCYYCKMALPYMVIRSMSGIAIRCPGLAERANANVPPVDATPLARKKKKGMTVKKKKRSAE